MVKECFGRLFCVCSYVIWKLSDNYFGGEMTHLEADELPPECFQKESQGSVRTGMKKEKDCGSHQWAAVVNSMDKYAGKSGVTGGGYCEKQVSKDNLCLFCGLYCAGGCG